MEENSIGINPHNCNPHDWIKISGSLFHKADGTTVVEASFICPTCGETRIYPTESKNNPDAKIPNSLDKQEITNFLDKKISCLENSKEKTNSKTKFAVCGILLDEFKCLRGSIGVGDFDLRTQK